MIIAICAATPFQSLNAVNLAMHSLDSDVRKILFYRNYSSTTDKILQRIYSIHYLTRYMSMI